MPASLGDNYGEEKGSLITAHPPPSGYIGISSFYFFFLFSISVDRFHF